MNLEKKIETLEKRTDNLFKVFNKLVLSLLKANIVTKKECDRLLL